MPANFPSASSAAAIPLGEIFGCHGRLAKHDTERIDLLIINNLHAIPQS